MAAIAITEPVGLPIERATPKPPEYTVMVSMSLTHDPSGFGGDELVDMKVLYQGPDKERAAKAYLVALNDSLGAVQ